MLKIAILTIFPFAMLVAASTDFLTMKIPNWISLMLIAGFLLLAPFVGLSWSAFGLHLAAGVGMLVIGMVLFALGWMGGGDVKFIAATGLWLGFDLLLYNYALVASVFGAFLTLILVIYRWMPLSPALMPFSWANLLHEHKGVPYGIALALAGLVIYPHTFWMTSGF